MTAALKRVADGRHADPDAYTALAVLIGDAALESDESSLIAGRRGLQRVFARRLADAERGLSEERGRVLAMLDVIDWMLRRMTPIASLASLRRGTTERHFLELLADERELSDAEAAELLEVEESTTAEAGLRLQQMGAVRARTIGGERIWEITPRGRDAVLIRLNLRLDSRGVRNAARQILEPDQLDGPQSRRRPVTSGIVAALLTAERPLTIDELADETRHKPSRVRLGVHALVDRGVLSPAGVGRYAVQDDRYCAIGVEVLPCRLLGIVTDLRGEPLRTDQYALADMRPATVVDGIAELVSRLREPSPDGSQLPPRLLGLGLELGGHVDCTTGNVILAANVRVDGEPWRNVELGALTRGRTGLVTVVENDANALATYQQLFRRLTEETENLAVVTVGDGVGAGLIVKGEIVHGANGLAGEIGHLIINPGGPLCGCGHHGCVEAYAAVPNIIAASRAESLENAAARAEAHPEAQAAFRSAGEAVGRGIAALENLLNPSEVLVAVPHALAPADGEQSSTAAQIFADELRQHASKHAFSTAACPINIRHVPNLAQYGAQGAAAALLRRFVELPLQAIDVETVPQAVNKSNPENVRPGPEDVWPGPPDVEVDLDEVMDAALVAATA